MGEFCHETSVQQKPLRAHAPDGPPQGEPKPPARPQVSRDMKLPLQSGQRDSRKEVENQPQGGVLGSPKYRSDTIPSTSASKLDPANTGDVGGVHSGPRSAPPSGLNAPHQHPSSKLVHSEHIASPGYPAIQASEMHPEQNQGILIVGNLSKFKHDGSSANSGSGKSHGQLSGGFSAPNTFHSDPTVLSQHMSSGHDPSHVVPQEQLVPHRSQPSSLPPLDSKADNNHDTPSSSQGPNLAKLVPGARRNVKGHPISHSDPDRVQQTAHTIQPNPGDGGNDDRYANQFENPLQRELDDEIHQSAAQVIQEVSGGRQEDPENTNRPFDPNLICPMCMKKFRIGEIQFFKRHVNTCDGTDDEPGYDGGASGGD